MTTSDRAWGGCQRQTFQETGPSDIVLLKQSPRGTLTTGGGRGLAPHQLSQPPESGTLGPPWTPACGCRYLRFAGSPRGIIRCKCTLFGFAQQPCIGRCRDINHGNCNFCYQSNTDQKGSLSPPLTCETSQLYSLEMTGALNSSAEQMTTINHV